MANQYEVYSKLSGKLNAPGSIRLMNILDAMVTPEESELLLDLWSPTTCADLANKLNIDEKNVRGRLENLTRKKIITEKSGSFSFHNRMIPLCHATVGLSAKSDELWTEFFFKEWRYILAEERYQRRLTGRPSVHRILPALQALAVSKNIKPEQVLWYENLDALLARGTDIIFAPCTCRRQYHQCNNKVELCMHVSVDQTPIRMMHWPNLKHYTYQEALDELYASEDAGMCHLSQNHPQLRETCNCCDDCCRVINPLINAAKDYDLNDPTRSRFRATIDQDKCDGCQTCVERCMFNAVEMVKTGASRKMKSHVISKKCMGCGLCVYKCPQNAIRFDIVQPPEHIPAQTRDRAMSWDPTASSM